MAAAARRRQSLQPHPHQRTLPLEHLVSTVVFGLEAMGFYPQQ